MKRYEIVTQNGVILMKIVDIKKPKPGRRPTWKPGQEISRAIKRDRLRKEKQLREPRR